MYLYTLRVLSNLFVQKPHREESFGSAVCACIRVCPFYLLGCPCRIGKDMQGTVKGSGLGNTLYGVYVGIIFPYYLRTSSKFRQTMATENLLHNGS